MQVGEVKAGKVIITRNEDRINKCTKPTTTETNKRTRFKFRCIDAHSKNN